MAIEDGRCESEDQRLGNRIANQIAMAIKNSHLVDMLAQKNLVKGFFHHLMYSAYDSEDALKQRANFIGCDLMKPHTVTLIELSRLDEKGREEDGPSPSPPISRRPLAETLPQT